MPPLLPRTARPETPRTEQTPAPVTPFVHSRQVDWPGEPPGKRFFPLLRQALDSDPESVVLAAGPELSAWRELFARAWPDLDPVLVDVAEDPSEVHARLALAGPFDVIVQASDTAAEVQDRLFERLFFHLRKGGAYLIPRMLTLTAADTVAARAASEAAFLREQEAGPLPNEDGVLEPPYVGEVWDRLAEAQSSLLRNSEEQRDRGRRTADVRRLGRHLGQLQVSGPAVRVTNSRETDVKLTEAEADVVLAARPDLGREVAFLPPTTTATRGTYRHNLEDDPYFSAEMAVPKLTLREYLRPVCSRGQVVTSGRYLWPDTYRHHLAPRLHNFYVEESAPRFGRLRRDSSQADELDGAWFNLDSEWPGHYGHTMTELLGRMWAWDQVRSLEPEVRCLMTLQRDRSPQQLVRFELDILSAFGISGEDVHVFERPCRPERLYSATSMFSLPDYVHPQMVETWDRVGDHLAAQAEPGPRPRRIFCTRPGGYKRSCRNTAAVEELFAAHGFEVLRPEQYPLPDQVAMFRAAEAIGGFGGSALFTTALCPTPKTVFTVAPTSYTARNEHLIAAARGHHLVSAWSAPGIAHPDGGWTQQAYASDFDFDVQDEGAFLAAELSKLGPMPSRP